jgi:hypothetical protein
MRPTTSNIFHTSLAFLPSSLTATKSMRVGDKVVGIQWFTAIGSHYGRRDVEAASAFAISPALQRSPLGGNA